MTAIRRRLALAVAAWASLCLAGTAVRAGGLEVAPIGVDFAAGQMAQTITVTNRATAPATVQLRTFDWSQPGGIDRLAPTDAVVASPPIVTIPPGREQVIRVLLRRPAGAAEKSYRLMVEEIPVPVPGQINLALHLSLPIFVSAAAPGQAKITWSARPAGGGVVELAARNDGTRHAKFDGLTITTRGGAASQAFSGYVLPGQEKRWRIPLRGLDRAGQVTLRGAGDQGGVDATIALDGSP